jgi:hypothetical protein
MRLGVLGPTGHTTWPVESVRRNAAGWSVLFASPQAAAGLVVSGPARSVSDDSVATAVGGQRWALDGILQDALSSSSWRYAGSWKGYAKFVATHVLPPVWISAPSGGADVRQVATTDYGTAVERLRASRPVEVVRSEAYAAGWHAEIVPAGGGPAKVLPVVPVGLVQGVRVPAGDWTITFSYRPTGLDVGLAGSVLGLAGFVAVAFLGLARRRRSRPPGATAAR